MSVHFSAFSLIGLRIPEDTPALHQLIRERGCNHEIQPENKFCSICGKPAWVETTTQLDIEHLSGVQQELVVKYGNSDLFGKTGCDVYITLPRWFVGNVGDNERDHIMISAPDILPQVVRDQLKAILEPFNLWNDNWFGWWIVMTWG